LALRAEGGPMRLLISAGEASGENYGAQLIAALRRRKPVMQFFGVGGERMRAAGCDTVVNAGDVAVVGLAEVVTHLPGIYGKFRKLLREVDQRRPDAAILIDFPDFNLRLARQLHRRGIPVIYYVSPQLWAWRPGRIELVRKYVRKMLCIFPFEEQWYRERGVDAEYVGHPLADIMGPPLSREQLAARAGVNTSREWIALLPGSRLREAAANLPTMLRAAELIGSSFDYLFPVASTVDHRWAEQQVRSSPIRVRLICDSLSTLAHARAAVVASGTATVEAAVMNTPLVMVYRLSPLTWALGRRMVKLERFAMPNLIAGRDVVPELVQHAFTPENVAARLKEVLAEGAARAAMLSGLADVRERLRAGAGVPAADRAACALLKVIQ
jgi:lipid-A-disaccharide synthase